MRRGRAARASPSGSPACVALDGRQLRRRGRLVPRALRRERRRQEHARQDPRRHSRARRRGDLLDGAPVRFAPPRDALRRRRRDGAPGARVLRQHDGRREPVPRRICRTARSSSIARRDARRARAHARRDRRRSILDVDRLVGELTVGRAAGGADRRGGRRRRAGHRLRRADEQPRPAETERLYALIARLRARGVTMLYVSHRMPEIFRLCDTITVLRDGRHVGPRPARELDEATLVQQMIGRRARAVFSGAAQRPAGEAAARRGAVAPPRFQDVCFPVRRARWSAWRGSSAPAARTWRARCSASIRRTGDVEVGGVRLPPGAPAAAMRAGVGFVPEDRKRQGLVLEVSGLDNVTLPILARCALAGGCGRARRGRGPTPRSRASRCASRLEAPRSGCRAGTSRRSCWRSGSPRAVAC